MKGETCEFLRANGISEECIDKLVENKIFTLEDLRLLSQGDLSDLFPLVGPKNRVKAVITKLNEDSENSQEKEHGDQLHNNGGIKLTTDQQRTLREIVNEAENNTENNTSGRSNDMDMEESTNSSDESETESRAKSSKSKSGKTASNTNSTTSNSYDLEEVLAAAGGAGQLILNVYKATGVLSDSNRASLAKIIINNETAGDFGRRVTKDRAKFLGNQVKALFDSELLSTWFRVETRADGSGKVVKGRIIRRYYTQRRTFKRLGVLNSTSDSEEDEDDLGADLEDSDLDEGTNASLTWLANLNLTPWPRVLSAWKETSKKRLTELQKPEREPEPEVTSKRGKQKTIKKKTKASDSKVVSYTETYPQVTEPQGWTLLEVDFEHLQKNALLKMDLGYQKLEKFVLHKLRSLNKDFHLDEFDQKPQCERSLFIFLSLSQLFPVTTVANLKDAHWRPSRQEMKDGFLLQAKTYGDLKTILEARQNKLHKFKLTCQPLPIVIKEKSKQQTKYRCLVKYDNFEYANLESPIKAVDVAFKSYHALHAHFPAESDALWLFLQKAVYGFSTKWDKNCNAVDTLVEEYSRYNP